MKSSGKSKSTRKRVPVHEVVQNDANDSDSSKNDEEEESAYRDPPAGFVRLRPSHFKGIPSTVFIEYPPELGIKRVDISKLEELGSRKLQYTSYWERICIKNAFLRAGFVKNNESTTNYWTVMWSKHQNESQLGELNCLQKVNHFPNSWCIGRKDRLTRTINTMKRIHGNEFSFHPDSYILPQERDIFMRLVKTELTTAQNNNTPANRIPLWIIKPVASSCGKGIKVLTSQQCAQLPATKKALLQRYLMKPYLINQKKFDLRLYVLVTGVDPLRIYIHEEGLTRISTSKYSLNNISNRFAHLTNYSVNKKASIFKAASEVGSTGAAEEEGEEETDGANDCDPDMINSPMKDTGGDPECEGYKWSLTAFRRWLTKETSAEVMTETFAKIYDLCIKTIISAEGEITPQLHSSTNYRTNCYELFGLDVILDHKLKPSLLEVNVSPSLMGSSPLDKRIKGTVVADMFHIVGIYPHDQKLLKKYTNTGGGPSGYNTNNTSANPFAFSSLSRMMNSQDAYRKNQCPASIDLSKLSESDDSSWLMLLMIEDEFNRAKSSRFNLVHPIVQTCTHYTNLYRNGRFSDHLLAKWILGGGSSGANRQYIPFRYLHDPPPVAPRMIRPASSSRMRPFSGNSLRVNTLLAGTTAASGGSGSISSRRREITSISSPNSPINDTTQRSPNHQSATARERYTNNDYTTNERLTARNTANNTVTRLQFADADERVAARLAEQNRFSKEGRNTVSRRSRSSSRSRVQETDSNSSQFSESTAATPRTPKGATATSTHTSTTYANSVARVDIHREPHMMFQMNQPTGSSCGYEASREESRLLSTFLANGERRVDTTRFNAVDPSEFAQIQHHNRAVTGGKPPRPRSSTGYAPRNGTGDAALVYNSPDGQMTYTIRKDSPSNRHKQSPRYSSAHRTKTLVSTQDLLHGAILNDLTKQQNLLLLQPQGGEHLVSSAEKQKTPRKSQSFSAHANSDGSGAAKIEKKLDFCEIGTTGSLLDNEDGEQTSPYSTLRNRLSNMSLEINKAIDRAAVNEQHYNTPPSFPQYGKYLNNGQPNRHQNAPATHPGIAASTLATAPKSEIKPQFVHQSPSGNVLTANNILDMGLTHDDIYRVKNNSLEVFQQTPPLKATNASSATTGSRKTAAGNERTGYVGLLNRISAHCETSSSSTKKPSSRDREKDGGGVGSLQSYYDSGSLSARDNKRRDMDNHSTGSSTVNITYGQRVISNKY